MTTLAREDLDKEKTSSSGDDVESFRTQGYEDIDPYCYYRVRDRTMLVGNALFEDLFEDLRDMEFLSMEDYFLSLDENSPEDKKKNSEILLVQCAFHLVCDGNIACKVTQVQGGYTFHVPSREVAREISRTLLKLIEEVKKGDNREDSVWKMLEKPVFYVVCFIILCLLGKLFL